MPTVTLGNVSAIAMIGDPSTGIKTKHRHSHITQSTTQIHIPPDRSFMTALAEVVLAWGNESDEAPAWLTSDDPDLQSALRKHFNCGDQPEDWENIISGAALLVPDTLASVDDPIEVAEAIADAAPTGKKG